MVIPVILSGGAGARLWPLAGPGRPKPFVRMPDGHTLLQHAFLRARSLAPSGPVMMVTGQPMLDASLVQWREMNSPGQLHVLAESHGRDTAAAFALALAAAERRHDPDTHLLLLPADHVTGDEGAFRAAMREAVTLADRGLPVLIGIPPSGPNTAFGYLEARGNRVLAFHEKPSAALASAFVSSGKHFWNSGMLLCSIRSMLGLLTLHAPALLEACRAVVASAPVTMEGAIACSWLDMRPLAGLPGVSLDRLVLENIEEAGFVKAGFEWRDLGSWEQWIGFQQGDPQGNSSSGPAVFRESERCFVHAGSRRVAAVGLKDVIIVDNGAEILVAARESTGRLRELALPDAFSSKSVALAGPCGDCDPLTHARTGQGFANPEPHSAPVEYEERPWGRYRVIARGKDHQVKRIEVDPGARLSLQSHRYRSEHWHVVSGIAEVRIGRKVLMLRAGGSADIPKRSRHRLANAGKVPLLVIEIQHGSYLGEDDEIRHEDDYGRIGQAGIAMTGARGPIPAGRPSQPQLPSGPSDRAQPFPEC